MSGGRRAGPPQQLSLLPPAAIAPAAPDAGAAALAAALPAGLHLGTSSWAFAGWRGLVYGDTYPEAELSRRGLGAYARHPLLRAVGIDRTHYRPLDAAALAALAAQVPPAFRFVMKAHALCTQRWATTATGGSRANPLFLDAAYAWEAVVAPFVAGLGPRGAVVLFQCAPKGLTQGGPALPVLRRLGAFLGAVGARLQRAAPAARLAVEVRDAALLGPDYAAALADGDALHCHNVHPSMPSLPRQRELLGPLPHRPLLVRWLLHGAQAYEAARRRYLPFDRLVDPDPGSRAAIAALVAAAAAAGQPAYVLINNKAEGSAPASAAALAALLAGR